MTAEPKKKPGERLIRVLIEQVVRDDIWNGGPISKALTERFGDKDKPDEPKETDEPEE